MVLGLQRRFSTKRPNPNGFNEGEDEEMGVFSIGDTQGKIVESLEFWPLRAQRTSDFWCSEGDTGKDLVWRNGVWLLLLGGEGAAGSVRIGGFISMEAPFICEFVEIIEKGCWWDCDILHAILVAALLWEGIKLWVFGSNPCEMSFFFMHEFQKFFTSLSVLPGRCFAIWAHLCCNKLQMKMLCKL